MADTERVIVVNSDQHARQQMVEDLKALKEKPLNRTIPGGYYLNPDGKSAHDAHGNPIPLMSEKAIEKKAAEATEEPTPTTESEEAETPAKKKTPAKRK